MEKYRKADSVGVSDVLPDRRSCAEMTVDLLAEYGITDRKTAFDQLIGKAKEL